MKNLVMTVFFFVGLAGTQVSAQSACATACTPTCCQKSTASVDKTTKAQTATTCTPEQLKNCSPEQIKNCLKTGACTSTASKPNATSAVAAQNAKSKAVEKTVAITEK
jgi:hypothetical protein